MDSGDAVVFPTRKVRALFAYLAANSNLVQLRERLAGLLWGDQLDQQARTNQRSCFSSISSLEPGILIVNSPPNDIPFCYIW